MEGREEARVVPIRREGGSREGGEVVIATYREIADHFGLKGPDQGRTKAKRAGWAAEPQNHPADPLRIRVPREAWEGASQARERSPLSRPEGEASRAVPSQQGEAASQMPGGPSQPPEIPALIKQLEASHETLREQLADMRRRLDRAEGEALDQRERAEAAEHREADTARRAEQLESEIEAWTAGAPLRRAWRALVFRRGR